MKKVLFFTMESCGPCKKISPQIEKICADKGVTLEKIQLDKPEGKPIGTYFGVFMTPEIIVLDNLRSLGPLDQNPGFTKTRLDANNLPQELENYLNPERHPGNGDIPPLKNEQTNWVGLGFKLFLGYLFYQKFVK
jgi:thiol-disulfide isomerase/thioredoxin